MVSTADMATQAVASFTSWVAERDEAGDWSDYIRAGKVNRTEVAKECGFGRAAWVQNPGLAAALVAVEDRLAAAGVLKLSRAPLASLSQDVRAEIGAADEGVRRAMSARASAEKRVKALEEQNAALRAANRDLTERLRRSVFAERHLAETGRMLPT